MIAANWTKKTMTNEHTPTDPHGLLTSGEALATEPELAKLLGVSRNALGILLRDPLYAHVRFVRGCPGGC
jgi:hypothetical protein